MPNSEYPMHDTSPKPACACRCQGASGSPPVFLRRFVASSLRRSAFSLVELLTVIFIISLLIAILVPSLNSARNAAKRATTAKTISTIGTAMEMFKNDNGKDFPQTNGYPPSWAHPPIPGYAFKPELGEFPFLVPNSPPVVAGAHWLPAMLIGVDKQGYIKKSNVPNKDNLRAKPDKWYKPDPLGDGTSALERAPLYLDPGGLNLKDTRRLPGRHPRPEEIPDDVQELPVIADAFDQPILYYAANTHGKATPSEGRANLVRDKHTDTSGGAPFYYHEDNKLFTGGPTDAEAERGWDFGGGSKGHEIARSGAEMKPSDFFSNTLAYHMPFAKFILDRKIYGDLAKQQSPPETTPLRPVNADSYLLISPGVDGRYGTSDDVTNFPPPPEL